MIKNILHIIKIAAVSALIAGTAVSCLEKYPGSSIPEKDAMKTFSDAEQHNLGIYASLKSSALYSGSLTRTRMTVSGIGTSDRPTKISKPFTAPSTQSSETATSSLRRSGT